MTHETKDARALVERLRSIQPNWIDTAIGAEAAGALTAALDRADRAEARIEEMQIGIFYAEDSDGTLRRWYPPTTKKGGST